MVYVKSPERLEIIVFLGGVGTGDFTLWVPKMSVQSMSRYIGGIIKPKLMAIGVWRPPWRLEEASNEQFVFEGGPEWES